MITPISLVNIQDLIKIPKKMLFNFLMMRTFRIYSPSNFQIYCTVVLTVVFVLYTDFCFSSFPTAFGAG